MLPASLVTADRTAIVREVKRVLANSLRFPPGIDLGRDVMLTNAADQAVLTVERALGHPLRDPCESCDGSGRKPCGCWSGCPSTYQCERCEGEGKVAR